MPQPQTAPRRFSKREAFGLPPEKTQSGEIAELLAKTGKTYPRTVDGHRYCTSVALEILRGGQSASAARPISQTRVHNVFDPSTGRFIPAEE